MKTVSYAWLEMAKNLAMDDIVLSFWVGRE